MAKLGSAFSGAERRKAAARRLSPGAVVHIDVRFPEGPRSKYPVVASVDDSGSREYSGETPELVSH